MDKITQTHLISQTESGKIRILREEYNSVQVRYVVENEKYFNSHQNFYQAMKEYNEISEGKK